MIFEALLSFQGICLFSVALFTILCTIRAQRPRDLPPGPVCLPILGNLLWMLRKDQLATFRELKRKYGDVFSLMVGHRIVIVLNGYDTLKEAFVKHGDVFSDRPKSFAFDEMAEKMGVLGSSGPLWKEQRTFALTTLREFGFGRNTLEAKISSEVETFIDKCKKMKGKAFDGHRIISSSIGNVISSIVIGKSLEHDDPFLLRMIKLNDENSELLGLSGLLNFYPELKYLPGDIFCAKRIANNLKEIRDGFQKIVQEYTTGFAERDKNLQARNYIEAFLLEMKRRGLPGGHTFTERQLLFMLTDVFGAGFETTVTAIRWAILYLIQYPRVQNKMRQEIATIVGQSRPPSIQDRTQLKYCEATINEILRRGDIAPIILPHATSKDIYFRGLLIPKDAILIPNGNSVHFDPNIFQEPDKFYPERFLDRDGNLTGLDKLVPFSIGRRSCLGEALARMEMYLYITRLVQVFQLKPESEHVKLNFSGNFGVTFSPCKFKFRAVPIDQ